MSKSGGHKRRSIFGLPSFTHIHTHTEPRNDQDPVKHAHDQTQQQSQQQQQQQPPPSKTLRKRKVPVLATTNLEPPAFEPSHDDSLSPARTHPSQSPSYSRPTLSARSTNNRPTSSVFGSLRSFRSMHEDDAPLTTTSSKPPSLNWADEAALGNHPKLVLHHGEVQTSSSMFRKKKEYLALTETHIIRYKSQAKASESLSGVPSPYGRSPQIRHTSTQSGGSSQDLQSLYSDSSGDKEGRVPLRQVVAVHKLDDGRPYFAIEVCYLDEESSQASALTMQFADPEDRNLWLRSIRQAANKARLQDVNPVSLFNSKNAARAVERAHDYDPANFSIYKIVQRSSVKSSRSSTDDLAKVASTVCFLAVGIHKIHIIPLAKATSRTSSPSLVPTGPSGSYGILTLTHVRVHSSDDSFELTFRQPLKRPKTLFLASLASHDISIRLHHAENILRPDCDIRLFKFVVPAEIDDQLPPSVDPQDEEHCCFERTLTAYCISYDVNPSNIRYTIDYSSEDAPMFQLLPLADKRGRTQYSAEELLAVMRALRYNESFSSLSFSGVRLDILNGTHDGYGTEHVCTRTKRGAPIRLTAEELSRSCLLVQEIRALAATNKKLRRMDFSSCITTKPPEYTDDLEYRPKDIGCGIVEALFPLCKHQTTNVDWISLNGIHLSDTDLDYLVGAAVDKACHFRALELSRCSLTDGTLGLILDSLRAQDNTLEALDISGNLARLSPAAFDSQITIFGVIRKLNLSYTSRTSGSEPLLTVETLLTWRLEELRLTGTTLNESTVQALATYLRHPQSNTLRDLYIDHCYLSGRDVAVLMQAMTRNSDEPRHLHLDISHNNITKDHDQLTKAIASDHAPTHVTLRAIEYREESVFRHLINALRVNRSIRCLDISRSSLPNEVNEDTSQSLERFFAENEGLEDLDISGEDSRLETSRFGAGFNRALTGLKHNQSLHILRVQFQRLGLPGATILAEVLRQNHVLRELHCEHNDVPLSALTDMINSLGTNTTLVYLPTMDEGRAAALKHTELSVKSIRDETPMPPLKASISPVSSKAPSSFGVRKGLANVKKSVNRTASACTPSFPSLPSHRSASGSSSHLGQRNSSVSSSKTRLSPISSASAPLHQLSDQDIQAALRLVSESWDRQQYRLQQYLQRNLCILQGIPTAMHIEEEDFERPDSVGSLTKLLERVKFDSTPTAEKDLDFSRRESLSTVTDDASPSSVTTPEPPQLELSHLGNGQSVSFQHFMLSGDSSPEENPSPDEGMVLDIGKGRHGLGLEFQSGDQKTPTQQGFFE